MANAKIQDIIPDAIKERPNLTVVQDETKEALAAYYGGEKLYPYIYPFSRQENQEKLGWRRFQTVKHYRNFPKEIGKQYAEGVFRTKQIQRVYGDKQLDEYLSTDYDSWFKKEFALPSLYLPELFVEVSRPKSDVEPMTKQDDAEMDLTPYPTILFPHFIRNLSIDKDGDIEWISIKDDKGYRIYDEANVYEVDSKGNIKNAMPHGWDEVPVVRVAFEENCSYEGTPPVGHSILKEVVDLSIANLQYTSMLVEMGYFHLSYKIVAGEETTKKLAQTGVGNQTAIIEPIEESGMTRYLELPQVEIGELKDIVYERMPAAVFHAARLRDRSATIAQSGLAKAFDMVPETGALSSVADFWCAADCKIVDLLADGFLGVEKADALESKVVYPVTFDVRSPIETQEQVASFLDQAMKSDLPVSETCIREVTKQLQRAILPNADEELLATIDEETDNADFGDTAVEQADPTMANMANVPQQAAAQRMKTGMEKTMQPASDMTEES